MGKFFRGANLIPNLLKSKTGKWKPVFQTLTFFSKSVSKFFTIKKVKHFNLAKTDVMRVHKYSASKMNIAKLVTLTKGRYFLPNGVREALALYKRSLQNLLLE